MPPGKKAASKTPTADDGAGCRVISTLINVDLSRWSCGGAVHGRSCTTSRAGFLVGCGHEAEGLDIAEPAGKRVLDQARRQRRRPAPATDPQKREHLRLRPRGQ